ncbi:MAG TPA: hypothetical protein VJ385_06270 [Fibrobacteria bacterium]|nr:hypothetical protein [Fibrobacteria bacterium]
MAAALFFALGSAYSEITHTFISFDDITPAGVDKTQCWNSLGMDDKERIYVGWTSIQNGHEDYFVFRYDPTSGERKFLGSFMGTSQAAGNLQASEEIPKGHTHMPFIEGKMYMGSQGFHDFKDDINELPKYRGSHLYTYDVAQGKMEDVSKGFPGGVITDKQGIVALTYSPWHNLLIGLSHPLSDIVLFDYKQNKINKIIPGIPWTLGNPTSREVVVTKRGKIYIYRGTEHVEQRNESHPIWVYDMATGVKQQTAFSCSQGFWNGQTATADGNTIFLSTVHGNLYELDVMTDTWKLLGHFLPKADYDNGMRITRLYGITLSPDEKVIYGIPSTTTNSRAGVLYQYDRATGQVTSVRSLGQGSVGTGCYTGSNLRDSRGNIYSAAFGNTSDVFNRQCRLAVIHVGGTLVTGIRAGNSRGQARKKGVWAAGKAGSLVRLDGREIPREDTRKVKSGTLRPMAHPR